MDKAWHLSQEGNAYTVPVHLYVMDTDDLSSEADVASFMIYNNEATSNILPLCNTILDAWMALLIKDHIQPEYTDSDINDLISDMLRSLPYHLTCPLTEEAYLKIHDSLNNYYDYSTYQSFLKTIENNMADWSKELKDEFNQKFCRVRVGGQYNTERGSNTIWFRISSVGYNWNDVIYVFTSNLKNKYDLKAISIVRDAESDETEEEYVYKAKDGTQYLNMPLDEFLSEEHESNPVFANTTLMNGIITYVRASLSRGFTFKDIDIALQDEEGIEVNTALRYRPYLLKQEKENCIKFVR